LLGRNSPLGQYRPQLSNLIQSGLNSKLFSMADEKILSVLEEIRDIQKESQRIALEGQELVKHTVERQRRTTRPLMVFIALLIVVGILQVIFR
jgi:predicted nucleic acid-binding Zn ribbon protein